MLTIPKCGLGEVACNTLLHEKLETVLKKFSTKDFIVKSQEHGFYSGFSRFSSSFSDLCIYQTTEINEDIEELLVQVNQDDVLDNAESLLGFIAENQLGSHATNKCLQHVAACCS